MRSIDLIIHLAFIAQAHGRSSLDKLVDVFVDKLMDRTVWSLEAVDLDSATLAKILPARSSLHRSKLATSHSPFASPFHSTRSPFPVPRAPLHASEALCPIPRFHIKHTLAATAPQATSVQAAAQNKPQVVFVLGGPGSGKGTQTALASEYFGMRRLDAGQLLRDERQRGTEKAKIIEDAIRNGRLVPSEITTSLFKAKMDECDASVKFIIDGFPRSMQQLAGWETALGDQVDVLACFSLEVKEDELRDRVLLRAKDSGRLDDNEETLVKRIESFVAETSPVLDHFEAKGLLRRVNGEGTVEQVWATFQKGFMEVLGSD
eukprot:gnl/MRDRNA2_/MRDRNA2_57981_c0_seq1.p1 gnl/MRDRNA2_/MRDRNA2_57981_c0~~gnl/MRDRNA2_/MRDRNA2_57981_c0_seq1.p1  ORF type:complete len:319 (-),score=56.30 gnl/MRDRNA2_/MRDRNA2_57981_c0_seq1:29-985(-)